MGHTSTHRDKGISNDEFFRAELPETLTVRGQVLASATRKGAYYAAVKNHDTGEVWALVVKILWTRDWFNFTYKEMDEAMGPGYQDAPAKVLDLLTPTDSEWANEWRAACRANLAKREAARQVKRGAVIKFPQPLEFSNGWKADTFRLVERNTFTIAGGLADGARVRIPNWREDTHQVVS